jgi:hypothetical protein
MIIARRARNARGLGRSRQHRRCFGRQLVDQLNGWERAHEGHGLARPEWRQPDACRFVRNLPERAGEARLQRKPQCLGTAISVTKRSRMARARRPVTALVISIASSVPARSRARYSGVTAVSGQPRNAVPSLTPLGPRARAAAIPLPSAMPPAGMTGTRTASTICGTSDRFLPARRGLLLRRW